MELRIGLKLDLHRLELLEIDTEYTRILILLQII